MARRLDAERARTQLVEVAPHEADGHRRLAEVRQAQDRPAEAVVQWRHVVRIRTDEPNGWLGLADALIATGEHAEAKASLEHVLKNSWDERFGDVHERARTLMSKLD